MATSEILNDEIIRMNRSTWNPAIVNRSGPEDAVDSNPDPGDLCLWWDLSEVMSSGECSMLTRALHWRYTGVILYPHNYRQIAGMISNRVRRVLHVTEEFDLDLIPELTAPTEGAGGGIEIISSASISVLDNARRKQYKTCLRTKIDDEVGLHQAIDSGKKQDYLVVSFKDPTNIPLELVIASLQNSATVLLKEMKPKDEVQDAVVSLGVMEVGSDGLVFTPKNHEQLTQFMESIEKLTSSPIDIEEGRIIKATPLGLGTRSCIDTTTLFSETEGMLVGSTSSGGLLCCAEVFFLPYMELRPFRVNAGSVHSYVFNLNDKTDYMSELRAGSPLMIVDANGKTRRTFVGRIKTEVRPLRLIEAEFSGGRRVNVIMQDDWHVRIFSGRALPLNITELRPGQEVLGHATEAGRHVGIRVSEQIQEL